MVEIFYNPEYNSAAGAYLYRADGFPLGGPFFSRVMAKHGLGEVTHLVTREEARAIEKEIMGSVLPAEPNVWDFTAQQEKKRLMIAKMPLLQAMQQQGYRIPDVIAFEGRRLRPGGSPN